MIHGVKVDKSVRRIQVELVLELDLESESGDGPPLVCLSIVQVMDWA